MASAVYGLKLINLRNDLSDSEFVKQIKELFISIGLQLSGKHIRLKDSNSGKTVTAFITLNSIEEEQEATRQLQNPTIQLRALIQNVESHAPLRVEACNDPRSKSLDQFPSLQSTIAPSSHHVPSTTSAKTNQDSGSVEETPRFTLGQQLGNETRGVEYKFGQGMYMAKVFRSDLEKYACGYLNSQGGSLLIGVNDKGIVHGVKCSQQEEDTVRKNADQAMKNFKPAVFPDMYTIDFHPVFDKLRKPLVETKIVEVVVSNVKVDQLFETPSGQVFLRRDGSTEIMKPHEIQTWTRRRLQGVSSDVSMTDVKMKEKKNLGMIAELDRLRKSHENLKKDYDVLLNKKSKVCTIL